MSVSNRILQSFDFWNHRLFSGDRIHCGGIQTLDSDLYRNGNSGISKRGAKSCIGVAAAMASVGILTNCITATGLANRLAGMISSMGRNRQVFSLIITMFWTLLFGVGTPRFQI